MMQYRILENMNTFTVQALYKSWKTLDSLGGVWKIQRHRPSRPTASFDTLKDAKKFVKQLQKGVVIHEL